jgi:3-methyladenine DNA glycosylase AlkD
MNANEVAFDLNQHKDSQKAIIYQRFFKTGPGDYGEGDVFIGLTMPQQRSIAQKYKQLDLDEVQKLLISPIHEYRMTGLLILTYKYPKASPSGKEDIFRFYLNNLGAVNNWDLVDVTTPKIIGFHILHNPKERIILEKLAMSANLWERRVSMLATFPLIRSGNFTEALKVAEILLHDKHDLIHKAVGWMLREIGKHDQAVEEEFLEKFRHKMPRTMLRYAIKKFDSEKRSYYLS